MRPARTGEKNPDTRDWLTRYLASDLLGCSLQTLANYEERGYLHPRRAYRPDKRGVEHLMIVYDPEELTKLKNRLHRPAISPRDPGEITAKAFELFEEGKNDREVIRALRLTVEAVRELHEKWENTGGIDSVVTPSAKDALEKIVGPFDSVTDLVECLASTKTALEAIVGPFKTMIECVTLLKKQQAP